MALKYSNVATKLSAHFFWTQINFNISTVSFFFFVFFFEEIITSHYYMCMFKYIFIFGKVQCSLFVSFGFLHEFLSLELAG